MKKHFAVVFFIILFLLISGCATTPNIKFKINPEIQTTHNQLFDASIKPFDLAYVPTPGYCAFILIIINNSDKELEVDWNRTLYVDNGKTNGSFMFEGIVYKDRNNPKSPDIIFPKSEFSKIIWPSNLVTFEGMYWLHHCMGEGNKGVSLSIKSDGKEIRENLILEITS